MGVLTSFGLTVLPARADDVPVTLGRDEAQRLAREELANPRYTGDDQPLVQRAIAWVIAKVSELIDRVSTGSPLGWLGLVGLLAVVVVVVVVVRRRTGSLGRGMGGDELFASAQSAAADHRRAAERYASAGAWAEAVRERLRAVVRDLEERGLLDVRPGRTADEAARDAGRVLPGVADDLRRAARTFDDVWYGGREADAATYASLVAADSAVAAARPGPSSASPDPSFLVPR